MRIKTLFIGAGALQFLPTYAQGQGGTPENSFWMNLLVTVLPIAFVVLVIALYLRWIRKSLTQPTLRHYEKQTTHMERVERSLERIVKALENRSETEPNQTVQRTGASRSGSEADRTPGVTGSGR
jgi:hypothetical protein